MAVRVKERPAGSGCWWVFINHKGRRKARKIGTDKKLAMAVAKQIEARLVLGDFDMDREKTTVPTFREVATSWLDAHVKMNRRQGTHSRYSSILQKYLVPSLGAMPMDQVTKTEIIKVLRSMQALGRSKSSIELAINVLNGVCEFAIDEDLLPSNPCQGILKRIGLRWDDLDKEKIEVFTKEEVTAILDGCRAHFPEYYPFFLTAFRSGMRLGEIIALHWGDIDWAGRFVVVQRSFKSGCVNKPKNGKSRRVDLSSQLVGTLHDHQIRRKTADLQAGVEFQPIIFCHKAGGYIAQNTIRNIWSRLLAKCGLHYRKFHTIRHTFASLLISSGESLAYIKELMGHSSIQITVDVYGHFMPKENRDAVDSLDDDATKRNPGATNQKGKAVIPKDYGLFLAMVPKVGLEPT